MRVFGILLLVVGALALLVGTTMDTTVPTGDGDERVHNIGLMNDKQNSLLFGVGIAIVGAIFVASSSRKRSSPVAPQHVADDPDTRLCPYCAERIKAQAVICRFCNRDVTSAESPPAVQQAAHTQEELLVKLGITFDGSQYHFQQYRYDRVEDAVAYAQRQQRGA
jgi:hypothetical protein